MSHRSARDWHKALEKEVLERRLDRSSKAHVLTHNFRTLCKDDLKHMSGFTDDFLKKKRSLDLLERDEFLEKLISSVENDLYIHAFLSCVHRLSPGSVRKHLLLMLQQVGNKDHATARDQYRVYITILVYVVQLNPSVLSQSEATRAIAIQGAFSARYPSAADKLAFYARMSAYGVKNDLFVDKGNVLYNETIKLWAETKAKLTKAKEIPSLEANQDAECLRTLKKFPNANFTDITKDFPDWTVWADWSPSIDRLQFIDKHTEKYGAQLCDLFKLEGPDFQTRRSKNLLQVSIDNAPYYLACNKLRWNLRSYSGTIESLVDEAYDLFENARKLETIPAMDFFCNSIMTEVFQVEITFKIVRVFLDKFDTADTLLPQFEKLVGMLSNNQSASLGAEDELMKLLPLLKHDSVAPIKTEISTYLTAAANNTIRKALAILLKNLKLEEPASQIALDDLSSASRILSNYTLLDGLLEKEVIAKLQTVISCSSRTAKALCEIELKLYQTVGKNAVFKSAIKDYAELALNIVYFPNKIQLNNGNASQIIPLIIDGWIDAPTNVHRSVVLFASSWAMFSPRCFGQVIPSIVHELSEQNCSSILALNKQGSEANCMEFAALLNRKLVLQESSREGWTGLFYVMLSRFSNTMTAWAANNLTLKQWIQWHQDVHTLFHNEVKDNMPLHQDYHNQWRAVQIWRRLSPEDLRTLNGLLTPGGPLKQILLCDWKNLDKAVAALSNLAKFADPKLTNFYEYLFVHLSLHEPKQAEIFGTLVEGIASAPPVQAEQILALVEISKAADHSITSGLALGYLNSWGILEPKGADKTISKFATGLVSFFTLPGEDGNKALSSINEFLQNRYQTVLSQLGRIGDTKRSLKLAKNAKTSELLTSLGLAADEPLTSVPINLINVIEEISFSEYDMLFPLDMITPLQRIAMGIGEARCAKLRLDFGEGISRPTWCMHLDTDWENEADGLFVHTTRKFQQQVSRYMPCGKSKPNLIVFQVDQYINRNLATLQALDFATLYPGIVQILKTLTRLCLVCGSTMAAPSYIPQTCGKANCLKKQISPTVEEALTYSTFCPEIYDLLLSSVYANAAKNTLAANCADLKMNTGSSGRSVAQMIDRTIPYLGSLSKVYPDRAIDAFQSFEEFSACNLMTNLGRHSAFLAEAKVGSQLHIPGFPEGVRQFVVGSMAQTVTVPNAQHMGSGTLDRPFVKTQVAFLWLDDIRWLWPILQDGLQAKNYSVENNKSRRILEGTKDVIEEGLFVCTSLEKEWPNAGAALPAANWGKTEIGRVRVVLGVEVAGEHWSTEPDRMVIKTSAPVAVRYVFTVPTSPSFRENYRVPKTEDVILAMESAFIMLKSAKA